MRAGAFNVAVGQRAAGAGTEGTHGDFLNDVTLFVEGLEQILGDSVVIPRCGAAKKIVAEPKIVQVVTDHGVVPVRQFLRRHSFLVRLHGDGGSMFVGAAHHQHIIAGQAVIAGEDIAGHAKSGDMSDMPGTVGIRPRNRNENFLGHVRLLLYVMKLDAMTDDALTAESARRQSPTGQGQMDLSKICGDGCR